MLKGIDVAKWNAISDYESLRESGVQFAITKVINKSNKPDDGFTTHIENFKAVGIPCSMGYTYSYANTISKAIDAANSFVSIGKEQGIDYMWLDLEDTSVQGLGSKIVSIIDQYKTIAENNGMKFGIYTYYAYYTSYIKDYIKQLAGIPFWIARYPSKAAVNITDNVPETAKLPNGINISGWQYSSQGIVPGVSGYVDMDVWYEGVEVSNNIEITIYRNPFTEPTANCTVGTLGNDANYCLYCLWRCGKLLDDKGNPDSTQINSVYSRDTAEKVKEVQKQLGLKADGVVGPITRAAFKKIL